MSVAPLTATRLGTHPYLLLSIVAFNWGANAVAGRASVGEASPMVVVCLRWFVVLAVLAVLARDSMRAEWRTLLGHAPYLLAMGGLGYTAFNAAFYWSAQYTTAINMGVIQGIAPALAIAGAYVAYGTPIGARQALGLGVMFVGVLIVTSRGDWHMLLGLNVNIGDLAVLVATALYAGYAVALRRRPAVSPLAFFTAMSLAAFATSLPLLGWEVASGTVRWPSAFGWALIVFIALGPSLLSQLLFMRAVDRIGPGRAALFMNLIPIVAAGLAVLLLGETFAPYHAAALACVLGGIWLAESGSVRA